MSLRKRTLAKFSSFLTFLLVFLLPSQLGFHFWPRFAFVSGLRIDYYSPTIYLTDILLIITALALFFKNCSGGIYNTINSAINRTTTFLFFILIFSLYSIKTPHPWLHLYGLLRIIEVFLLFWIIKNLRNLKPVFWGLIGAVSYTSILAFVQFWLQRSVSAKWYLLGERWFTGQTPGIAQTEFFGRLLLRPYATFSHPNSMAGFLLVSLWLIWYLANKVQLWRLPAGEAGRPRLDLFKILTFLSLTFAISGIILSFSHTAWLALLLTLFIKVRPLRSVLKKRSDLFKINLQSPISNLLLLTSLFFPLILLIATHFFPSLAQKEEVYLRNFLSQKGIEAFLQKPIFGQGINHFIHFLEGSRPQFLSRSFYQPVHNIFWLILAESGLIGLFFALKLSSGAIYRTINLGRHKWRHYNSSTSNLYLKSLSLSLVSIFLLGATDHYLLTLQQNRLLLAVFLGLAWRKIIFRNFVEKNSRTKGRF